MALARAMGALAIAADMATGRPKTSGLTSPILAANLARKLGLDLAQQKVVYFTMAARFLGCTITSHETAQTLLMDDQGFAVATIIADWNDPDSLRETLDEYAAHNAAQEDRDKAFDFILENLAGMAPGFTEAHCRTAYLIARRLPVPEEVCECIPFYYARHDGALVPIDPKDVPYVSWIVRVAEIADLVRHFKGREAAVEAIRAGRGKALNPEVCDVFLAHANELLDDLVGADFEDFVDAEPGDPIEITPACIEVLAENAGTIADNKSVFFLGHSRRALPRHIAGPPI